MQRGDGDAATRRAGRPARSGAPAPLDSADVTTADQLPPQYVPGEVESRRYEGWVKAGYFTADAASPAPPFTIMIPPPNVTGSPHIGHALYHTLIDAPILRRPMPGLYRLIMTRPYHSGHADQKRCERDDCN